MPHQLPTRCKRCTACVENGDVISRRGLCRTCAFGRVIAANIASAGIDDLTPEQLQALTAMAKGWKAPRRVVPPAARRNRA